LLLRIASLLDVPDEGDVLFDGEAAHSMDDCARGALRSRQFGFVFAAPFLLPAFSIVENVAMPLLKLLGADYDEAVARTRAALEFVGMPETGSETEKLSPFDQQRVALARALVHQPQVLVLDHADAALTLAESAALLALARRARDERGATVLAALAASPEGHHRDRLLAVEDGAVLLDSERSES
jgi:ABC-type lipoprotein export system ATPase subunit